jgi:hydroxyacylglutathione hydrolase
MKKNQIEIVQLACLDDNYCSLVHDHSSAKTVVIDTPDAEVITCELEKRNWHLSHILTTHHHWDHIAGHQQLKTQYDATVVGPAANREQIPELDIALDDGEHLSVGAMHFAAIATPGHTLGHLCYWLEAAQAAFVGDTLFSMGCGRLFEGSATQMWHSMVRLRQLPPETALYCGHEYTLNNAKFAMALDPTNKALQQRFEQVSKLREQGLATVPSTLAVEMKTNPFLRADILKRELNMPQASAEEVFAHIRHRKDHNLI